MKKTILFLITILTTSLNFGQSVTGTGTLNRIPRFISSGVIGDSNIADSNTAVGVAAPSSIANTLTVNNTSYSSLDVNGTVSIGLGFANHIGAKIEGFKQTVNTTGLKLYTEVGFNNPSLAMTILANGNIGIGGQTSILNKFEVKVPTSTGLSGVDGIAVHDGAANRMALNLGINTVGEYSWIQSSKGGIGSKNLSINPNGGNVGIGTTNPIWGLLQLACPNNISTALRLEVGGFSMNGQAKFMIDAPGIAGGRFTVSEYGNVGIGTPNPDSKLAVNGTIHSKEVKVDMNGWPDYVFKKEYNLPTLEEVEKQIHEKGHLKDIPSEEEVLKDGINLGEMNSKVLQKIEELTLYAIDQEKKTEKLSNYISELNKLIVEQNKRLEKLEK